MKRIANGTIILVSGMVIGAGCLTGWLRGEARAAAAHAVRGRYSQVQVTALAVVLARRLAPEAQLDAVEVRYQAVPTPTAKPFREWTAECANDLGERVGLSWNAENGRLIGVACSASAQSDSSHRLPAAEAVSTGLRWMRDLRIIEAESSWRVLGRPFRNKFAWVIWLQAGQDRITVYVDHGNGRLLYARLWL